MEKNVKLRPKSDGIIFQLKNLSASLRGITSKNNGDFYCLSCLDSFRTKNKLKSHKKVCDNKDFCNVIMSSEDNEILEYNQYEKSAISYLGRS